jgi:hypothetical protein
MDEKIIDLWLDSEFSVFEDGIKYFTAIENNLEIIITRNLNNFKLANVPIMTAENHINLK